MQREFDNIKLNLMINFLKERAPELKYVGDISDLGNEIGFAVGSIYENMTEEDIVSFIRGFEHGVSLTNSTH